MIPEVADALGTVSTRGTGGLTLGASHALLNWFSIWGDYTESLQQLGRGSPGELLPGVCEDSAACAGFLRGLVLVLQERIGDIDSTRRRVVLGPATRELHAARTVVVEINGKASADGGPSALQLARLTERASNLLKTLAQRLPVLLKEFLVLTQKPRTAADASTPNGVYNLPPKPLQPVVGSYVLSRCTVRVVGRIGAGKKLRKGRIGLRTRRGRPTILTNVLVLAVSAACAEQHNLTANLTVDQILAVPDVAAATEGHLPVTPVWSRGGVLHTLLLPPLSASLSAITEWIVIG